jgi:hypothetical protein
MSADLPDQPPRPEYRARHPGHTERIHPEMYRDLPREAAAQEWPTAPTRPAQPVLSCAGESTLTRTARLVGIIRDLLVILLISAFLVLGVQQLRGLRDAAKPEPTPPTSLTCGTAPPPGYEEFCADTPGG